MQAVTWYERQQVGLGIRFFEDFQQILARIQESRHQFPEVYRGIRRALLRKFPFGVFFNTYESRTVVIAIADLRRDPGQWQMRS